ncbi:MAG: uroporphyrinogen decarboxylase family protein [bacterium]
MGLTERENFLRAIEFRNPEWIPCSIGFSPLTWHKYRERLEEIVLRHPLIFRDYEKGSVDFDRFPPVYRKGYYRDNWGCLWHTAQEGLEGQVVESPLADWDAFDNYKPPDFLQKSERGERDWEKIRKDIEGRKKRGLLTRGDGERLFDRLYFLRGFENLMIDIATDHPKLPRLIEMLLDYEMGLVKKWLEIGVDIIGFHTDIGMQNGLMISPTKFRKYIKPMFKELFTTCRKAGVHVSLSSDGRLLEIVDDLVECGVSMHDPQLRANTLEGIAKAYKGKMCINLDLDRQMFPFCKPGDIREQVKDVVETLGSPEGGLMISGSIYGDDVPLENIEALCEACEEFCFAR